MKFWVDCGLQEDFFTTAALRAGHVRTSDAAGAQFYIIQSESLQHESRWREVADSLTPRFEFQVLDEPIYKEGIGEYQAIYRLVDGSGVVGSVGFAVRPDFEDAFSDFLLRVGAMVEQVSDRSVSVAGEVPSAVEEFLSIWTQVSDQLPLSIDERRVADALAAMAAELAKVADPPRSVLRAGFEWLGSKVDRLADEFAASAGKAAGTAIGVGVGVAVAGRLPQLLNAIEKVLRTLD